MQCVMRISIFILMSTMKEINKFETQKCTSVVSLSVSQSTEENRIESSTTLFAHQLNRFDRILTLILFHSLSFQFEFPRRKENKAKLLLDAKFVEWKNSQCKNNRVRAKTLLNANWSRMRNLYFRRFDSFCFSFVFASVEHGKCPRDMFIYWKSTINCFSFM